MSCHLQEAVSAAATHIPQAQYILHTNKILDPQQKCIGLHNRKVVDLNIKREVYDSFWNVY
jgi:hypothetical protein